MLITPAKYLPRPLTAELLAQPGNAGSDPGFIGSGSELIEQHPALQSALGRQTGGLTGMPCFIVPPEETPALFTPAELDLLRSLTRHLAAQLHPHLKTGVDAIWFVHGAFKLRRDWEKPDRNTGACLFKLAGLGLGMAGIAGSIYPGLKIPDAWANGLNFTIKSGGLILEGKSLPLNEMLLSSDKRVEIPLKILKAAGITLDPDPSAAVLLSSHQAVGRITPLGPVQDRQAKRVADQIALGGSTGTSHRDSD